MNTLCPTFLKQTVNILTLIIINTLKSCPANMCIKPCPIFKGRINNHRHLMGFLWGYNGFQMIKSWENDGQIRLENLSLLSTGLGSVKKIADISGGYMKLIAFNAPWRGWCWRFCQCVFRYQFVSPEYFQWGPWSSTADDFQDFCAWTHKVPVESDSLFLCIWGCAILCMPDFVAWYHIICIWRCFTQFLGFRTYVS